MLQFVGGIFVADDDSMGMLLQAADGPHVVDWLFYTMTKSTGFIVTIDHNHHLLGIHHRTYAYSQSSLWDFVDVIVKETTISNHCICCKCLLAGTALKTGSRLIEGDVAIGTYATHEEVNTTCIFDHFLVVFTLCLQILGISIEDMDIFFLNVDVAKEVVPHEAMITLWMILGEVHIFVHVERNDVLERYLACLIQSYQLLVHTQGRTSCRAA